MVTVAFDLVADQARSWIEAAKPTHPSLVDSGHQLNRLLGLTNVPMAVWIDESGTLVRPAEAASIEVSPFRDAAIPDDVPERLGRALTEIKAMPDTADAYRGAIVDWATNGADSRFAMTPEEVIAASQPRPAAHSEAAACFELGNHLHSQGHEADVRAWWKRAHALHRENWTYKRQAWTLTSTPEGEASDLMQEVGDEYGTSWLDDVIELGGGANYSVVPDV